MGENNIVDVDEINEDERNDHDIVERDDNHNNNNNNNDKNTNNDCKKENHRNHDNHNNNNNNNNNNRIFEIEYILDMIQNIEEKKRIDEYYFNDKEKIKMNEIKDRYLQEIQKIKYKKSKSKKTKTKTKTKRKIKKVAVVEEEE